MPPRKRPRMPQTREPQRGLFDAPTRPAAPRPRIKSMDFAIPNDKRFHETNLSIGEKNLGKIQYYITEKSTPQTPIIKIQFILPTETNKRFGVRLLAGFILQAKTKGVSRIVADVGEDNVVSQRLFERMGFSKRETPLGGREPDAGKLLVYSLNLSEITRPQIAGRLRESLLTHKRAKPAKQ